MSIVAVLQARMSSRRLPGKVLKPLLGKPMILRQIERLRRARAIDQLLLATSDEASDDPLAECCVAEGIPVFRGSLNDVLDRFYQAVSPLTPQHVVRLTADCPLADASVIDGIIAFHLAGGYDYSSNGLQPSFPDGLDVEIMRFAALHSAWREARLPGQREHVTPYLYQHPQQYRIGHYGQPNNLSALRWTVDEPADFELVERVYNALYPSNPAFTTADVLALLKQQPQLSVLNAAVPRHAGILAALSVMDSKGQDGDAN